MKSNLFVCLIICGALAAGTAFAAEPLSPRQFEKARAVIRPQAGEDRWDQIAWRTNLWEARKEAAAEGKPILLWEMDGHPLGCT